MNSEITFGVWLKRRRRQLDLTQKELANLAGCGLGTLRKIENGSRRPSKELAAYIGEALDIPAEQIPAFVALARSDSDMEAVPLPDFAQEQIRPPQPAIPEPMIKAEAPQIRHNLPPQPTPFIGRTAEIVILRDFAYNPDSRLITIVGPGGMGKTRLALAYAEQHVASSPDSSPALFPDGLFFIDLAPLTDPTHIIPALVKVLHFLLQDGGRDERSSREQLLDHLREKRLLLIMDNFEHLIAPSQTEEGAINLVTGMLQEAPGVQIIVTSRERLRLQQEQIYPIRGLEFPDWETPEDAAGYTAVQLFLQSARRNQPDFELHDTADLTHLARICRLVAGMPLALELAAAWVDMLSLQDIATELSAKGGQGLDLLETDYHDMPARHHSVRATIDYSWQKLNEQEQKVFAHLSVFRGGFTRQAGQRVAGASLALLARLVKKSLLQFNRQRGRYLIHELLRQYGAIKLQEASGEDDKIEELHSIYYAAFLQEREAQLKGSNQNEALSAIDEEIDNVRKSWRWVVDNKRVEIIAQSAECLGRFYDIRGWLHEGDETFATAEDILQEIAGPVDAITRDSFEEQLGVALMSILVWRGVFIYRLPGFAANSPLANQDDHYSAASQRLTKALLLAEGLGDHQRSVEVLNRLGRMTEQQGDYNRAEAYLERSLILARQVQDQAGMGRALLELGWVKYRLGARVEARDCFAESLVCSRSLGDRRGQGKALVGLGFVANMSDDLDEAELLLKESLALFQEIDDQLDMVIALNMLGQTANFRKDYLSADGWIQESLKIAREIGYQYYVGMTLANLGEIAVALGDDQAALIYYHESLIVSTSRGDKPIVLDALAGVAELLANKGRGKLAVEILSLVLHHPAIFDETKQITESSMAGLREQLPAEVFSVANERGRELHLEVTVTRLLAELDGLAELDRGTEDQSTSSLGTPQPEMSAIPVLKERFVQEELIAVGGMGEVYDGRDTTSGQRVAIKRLKPELATGNPELLARFAREGEALRQLNHPNIVQVLATIEDEKAPAIIMEYVPGGDLQALLEKESPLPLAKALHIALELADALGRAHHLGIIHRDIKPANVLLAEDGTPRLTDFGIARLDQRQTRLTQQGAMIGSPAYMSPELFQGEEADQRSDIWSFGVLLYELLAGLNPFDKPNISATLVAILNQSLPDITELRSDVSPPLAELLQQMLVKDRTQRLDSARQVAATLERIIRSKTSHPAARRY